MFRIVELILFDIMRPKKMLMGTELQVNFVKSIR